MHTEQMKKWTHDHVFAQDQKRPGEFRTLMIVILTTVMMVVEISAGLIYGSMALLADGLHMASHATALGIAVFAYVLSRRLAADRRFSFGVGKINSLAGFASAVMLLGFALVMVIESTDRLINPLAIAFEQALIVAVIGLVVNGVSAWVLISTPHGHSHGHGHGHSHDHKEDNHQQEHTDHQDEDHQGASHKAHGRHDHNLRAAYLHVVADALTSLLAIMALLAGKYWGASWLDPAMGIVGAILVTRWALVLIRETSWVLLDSQAAKSEVDELRQALELDSDDQIADVHLWSIGHGINAAAISVVTHGAHTPEHYKSRIPERLKVVHATVEIQRCTGN